MHSLHTRTHRLSWAYQLSPFGRSWNSNPQVRTLVESNQLLNSWYLLLPSQVISITRAGQGLVGSVSYQDGYRLVTVRTHGDFIGLPHCDTRPPAPWPAIPLIHIILTLSPCPILIIPDWCIRSWCYKVTISAHCHKSALVPIWR